MTNLPPPQSHIEEILKEFSAKFQHWPDGLRVFAEMVLSAKELKILDMRESGRTLEEVGKEFGVTRERVRQLEARADEKIRVKDFFKDWLKQKLQEATSRAYRRAHIEHGELLDKYSNWLHRHGYIDADYYAEEPKAVDAFLTSLSPEQGESKLVMGVDFAKDESKKI